jgi:flavin reductase (DIM6/NTAB) family NADH-FMN oxidoreductase RutF
LHIWKRRSCSICCVKKPGMMRSRQANSVSWSEGHLNLGDASQSGAFRDAMRDLASGVSLITVGEGDERTGFTATSLTSLSTEPASLLFCLNRQGSTWPILAQRRCFGVNILAAHHREVAEVFSGRTGRVGVERYADAVWTTLATGAPLLEDALAAFDCQVEETMERYSHVIVIGHVLGIRARRSDKALLYWRGQYADVATGV